MKPTMTATSLDYQRIFDAERTQVYPMVSELEDRMGHALDEDRLLAAARVLACPLKDNPPNWQHGRVLYAVARRYFDGLPLNEIVSILDIGTAKGFSALCMEWARLDSLRAGRVTSVDVLDPRSTERRNTVAEVDGPMTLADILRPWPEANNIEFQQATGVDRLKATTGRIHFAFVDGKHSEVAVAQEAALLAARQVKGDMVIFDDAQIPGVAAAIEGARECYELDYLTVKVGRGYAIARRR